MDPRHKTSVKLLHMDVRTYGTASHYIFRPRLTTGNARLSVRLSIRAFRTITAKSIDIKYCMRNICNSIPTLLRERIHFALSKRTPLKLSDLLPSPYWVKV